jgi:hypothetical protein
MFSLMSTGNKLLSKDGGLLLEAAPGINVYFIIHGYAFFSFLYDDLIASGLREYDWTKKSGFLLDPTECGEILYFHEKKTNEVNFLHDTFMNGIDLYNFLNFFSLDLGNYLK